MNHEDGSRDKGESVSAYMNGHAMGDARGGGTKDGDAINSVHFILITAIKIFCMNTGFLLVCELLEDRAHGICIYQNE